jgi:hypothetical protein
VTGNTAGSNFGTGLGGGISNDVPSALTTLLNTIVAVNTPSDCEGNITSNGYNMDSDNSCGFTATGDKPGVTNPGLGPLALNHPGTTETHALLDGSPAIDAVLNGCPPPSTDQRGVTRPQGSACDMGAYEKIVSVSGGAIPTLSDATRLSLAGLMLLGGLWALRRRSRLGDL